VASIFFASLGNRDIIYQRNSGVFILSAKRARSGTSASPFLLYFSIFSRGCSCEFGAYKLLIFQGIFLKWTKYLNFQIQKQQFQKKGLFKEHWK
jgi:hypothetical protein